MSIQKIGLAVLCLLITFEIFALGGLDTIPQLPPARGSNTEKWYAYKDEVQELFNDFSGDIVANKALKEAILSTSIQYLKTEDLFFLTNQKVYEVANIILSLETNSGILFVLENIDINIDAYKISDFFTSSHYPILHALYEQLKKDNEVIKMQVIGILLSGRFLENCDITQNQLQFYKLFMRYLDSKKYIEIKLIPNNYNCMGENLSVVVKQATESFDFGHIMNTEFK